MRARAEPFALDDAGGDGEHVLHGAADLDAGDVVRPVRPEQFVADRGSEVRADAVGRGESDGRRQTCRDVGGEARTGEHGGDSAGQHFGQYLAHAFARRLFEALGGDDDGRAHRHMRREQPSNRAQRLRGCRQKHDVLASGIGDVGCRADRGIEDYAR